jgi:hypothetical protein
VSLHRYLYANANPIIFTDPSGHFSLLETNISGAIQNILVATTQVVRNGLSLCALTEKAKSIQVIQLFPALIAGLAGLAGGIFDAALHRGSGPTFSAVLFEYKASPLAGNAIIEKFAVELETNQSQERLLKFAFEFGQPQGRLALNQAEVAINLTNPRASGIIFGGEFHIFTREACGIEVAKLVLKAESTLASSLAREFQVFFEVAVLQIYKFEFPILKLNAP